MKTFGAANIFLTLLVGILLIVLSILTPVVNNFADVGATSNFFTKANVYVNLSTLAKEEIKKHYPEDFAKRTLQVALADKVLETVVTPELTKNLVESGLKVSVKVAQTPTSIIDDKVVINTDQYKQQVVELLDGMDLGKELNLVANRVVDSVPKELVLVDTKERPNSILAWIIKLRTILDYSRTITTIAWIALGVSLIVILLNNLKRIKTIFLVIALGFGGAAVAVILLTLLVQAFTQPGLVGDVLNYVMSQINKFGIGFAIVTVVSLLIWKFVNFNNFQKKVNKKLH
jgi:hypothetical protein